MPELQPGDTLPADAIEAAIDALCKRCGPVADAYNHATLRADVTTALEAAARALRAQGAAAEREACAKLAEQQATHYAHDHQGFVAASAACLWVMRLIRARTTPCCDLHGRNCERPSEFCCKHCTEADHADHRKLGPCSNPDLSGTTP